MASVHLEEALSRLDLVFRATDDADELWLSMQWLEVSALADVLHAAGYAGTAANLIRSWTAVVHISEASFGDGRDSPTGRLHEWGMV